MSPINNIMGNDSELAYEEESNVVTGVSGIVSAHFHPSYSGGTCIQGIQNYFSATDSVSLTHRIIL